MDGPTHYEVWSTVEGARDSSEIVDTLGPGWRKGPGVSPSVSHEDAALALVDSLRVSAALQGFTDWAVYVMPHYCGKTGDCECAQWLTDHSPYASSETDNE